MANSRSRKCSSRSRTTRQTSLEFYFAEPQPSKQHRHRQRHSQQHYWQLQIGLAAVTPLSAHQPLLRKVSRYANKRSYETFKIKSQNKIRDVNPMITTELAFAIEENEESLMKHSSCYKIKSESDIQPRRAHIYRCAQDTDMDRSFKSNVINASSLTLFFAVGSAPTCNKRSTISACPLPLAQCRGVQPF